MKVFTFFDDSWYDSGIGCDCCPGQWMEAYNCSTTASWLGAAHSEEDCYAHAIITELNWSHSDEYMERCKYWDMSLLELKKEADKMNIKVEIIS
jgi:hypothetical protein